MNTLGSLAQNIQDFHLQDYAQGNEFFKEYHYRYLAATIYSGLLNEQYRISYAKNRNETGIGFPDINPEWFLPEEVKIERCKDTNRFIGKLCRQIFSFVFDRQACGLGEIVPVKSKCSEFMKIPADQWWSLKGLPVTSINWYSLRSPNEVEFFRQSCDDEKVLINYLPVLDPHNEEDDQYLPEALEQPIIERAMSWLKGFEGVIDMTNNGNPNKAIETEIDQSFKKTA